VSPDAQCVVYSALGKLWVKDLPDGAARRLTGDAERWELYPTWSPDGQTIVYAAWSDAEQGSIRTICVTGSDPRILTSSPGHYVEPAVSADGSQVVYRRMGSDALRGDLYAHESGVYLVPAARGDSRRVTDSGSRPRFNRTGERIYLIGSSDGSTTLESVDL